MKQTVKWAMNRSVLLAAACAVALIDQLLKRFIERYPVGQVVISLDPLFDIVRTANHGAAFSILSGETPLLIMVTTLMLLLLAAAVLFSRRISRAARWAMSVLLGGGVGNWLDRVAAGSVTDYIRLRFIRFPVFNFSDICITLAVLCLIALLLTNRFETTGEKHGTGH